MQYMDHSAEAKKIAKILSDGRLTENDLDQMALMLVMWARHPDVLERIEYFLDRFREHRYSVEFGEFQPLTREAIIAMMEG
mgnify:CR=1 FL=1